MGGNINRNVQYALCYLMVYCCRDLTKPHVYLESVML